jgi:hypothetical protein
LFSRIEICISINFNQLCIPIRLWYAIKLDCPIGFYLTIHVLCPLFLTHNSGLSMIIFLPLHSMRFPAEAHQPEQ